MFGLCVRSKRIAGVILGIDLLSIQPSPQAHAFIANKMTIRNNSSALKGFVNFIF
jgi:hypothetical protein